jgi:hypothetical protein
MWLLKAWAVGLIVTGTFVTEAIYQLFKADPIADGCMRLAAKG